jgi:hypothetical protein
LFLFHIQFVLFKVCIQHCNFDKLFLNNIFKLIFIHWSFEVIKLILECSYFTFKFNFVILKSFFL